jgi:hypothetical protein
MDLASRAEFWLFRACQLDSIVAVEAVPRRTRVSLMSTHEIVEHIEHAAHGGGAGASRYIGITMALLGVMVAFCSAMVGAQRTELIKAMVEQSTRMGTYQTETMKFRAMSANSELLKALSPAKDEIQKIESTLRNKRGAGGKKDDEDTAELKD